MFKLYDITLGHDGPLKDAFAIKQVQLKLKWSVKNLKYSSTPNINAPVCSNFIKMFKLGIERAKYLTLCKCPLLAFCIVKIKMFYLTQIKKIYITAKVFSQVKILRKT